VTKPTAGQAHDAGGAALFLGLTAREAPAVIAGMHRPRPVPSSAMPRPACEALEGGDQQRTEAQAGQARAHKHVRRQLEALHHRHLNDEGEYRRHHQGGTRVLGRAMPLRSSWSCSWNPRVCWIAEKPVNSAMAVST
jgi:hypothetical protein